MGTRWHGAMREALDLARSAPAHGDVPVGALILDPQDRPLASGVNERELHGDPTAHAEIVALRRAAAAMGQWRLDGCSIVVTLEPCTMCAGAVVAARLDRLIFGAFDEKAGAVASVFDVVRDLRLPHQPLVTAGVLGEECGALLGEFFAARRGQAGAAK